ncbi:MAG: GDP-mannose 4,6-dehydratase [Candidatus Hydrothermarchaeales archaeon]
MDEVLVTGCAGFIGSNVVDKLLEKGYRVIGMDNFADYYPREIKEKNISGAMRHENFDFVEGDILTATLPKVDYIIHEAAQAGVRTSWGKSFGVYTKNNILATQRLLEFYKDAGIKKFVYASSSSVYGVAELPMKEDALLKPISPYGVSKLAAEHLCYLYYESYGMSTITLRYFTVYGPRQRPDMAINRFAHALLNDEEICVFGDGEQTRDFTYVSDVVNATIRGMKSDVEGEVFNIGRGSQISINALISLMEDVFEKDAKVRYAESQVGDVRDTLADTEKAKRLGWKPKTALKEGLKNYAEWTYKERL